MNLLKDGLQLLWGSSFKSLNHPLNTSLSLTLLLGCDWLPSALLCVCVSLKRRGKV